MDRFQALQAFWASFNVNAYDENTVPDGATLPYITYDTKYNSFFGGSASMSASIWDRSFSWASVQGIFERIKAKLGEGIIQTYDGGALYIRPGSPYAQRIDAQSDDIRRILINIEVDYLEG